MASVDEYGKSLEKLVDSLDKPLGDFQYLLNQIDQEIEMLQELRGEACERLNKLAKASDLNK